MYTLESLLYAVRHIHKEIDGKWVPARPIRYYSWWHDLKDAWEVFRRRADAVKWPGDQ